MSYQIICSKLFMFKNFSNAPAGNNGIHHCKKGQRESTLHALDSPSVSFCVCDNITHAAFTRSILPQHSFIYLTVTEQVVQPVTRQDAGVIVDLVQSYLHARQSTSTHKHGSGQRALQRQHQGQVQRARHILAGGAVTGVFHDLCRRVDLQVRSQLLLSVVNAACLLG